MTLLLLGAGKQTTAGGSGDAPLYQSSEIGTVDASTLVVTFDRDVSAADYGAGVTIKVNSTATLITSATRQANHAIVHYAIPVLWHGSGDTVTWEYAQVSGNIVAESGGAALANVSAQAATNNCEYSTVDGVDLQADTQSIGALATWSDETPGSSRNFAQATGSAQPIAQDISGYRAVVFDDTDDEMTANDNFGDDLEAFTVISIATPDDDWTPYLFDKNSTGPGWDVTVSDSFFAQNVEQDPSIGTAYTGPDGVTSRGKKVRSMVKNSNSDIEFYYNGVEESDLFPTENPVTTFANAVPVTINKYQITGGIDLYCLMLFSPPPNAANRAALETRLAVRYGVTL